MNFQEVRKNIAHMIHEDPLGIGSPPITDPDEDKKIVNPKKLDMTNPIADIECEWMSDYVRVFDNQKELSFTVPYEDRTEGEIAAEVVKMFEHLR